MVAEYDKEIPLTLDFSFASRSKSVYDVRSPCLSAVLSYAITRIAVPLSKGGAAAMMGRKRKLCGTKEREKGSRS